MEIYQRNINTIVHRLGDGKIMVEASLLDLDHSARIYLTLEVKSGRVLEAKGEMPKVPFEACVKTLENLSTLVGLPVERGVVKEVAERLGQKTGCVHLVELAVNAVRLAGAVLVAERMGVSSQEFARLSEKERLRLGRPYLEDTCYVYSAKRLGEVLG